MSDQIRLSGDSGIPQPLTPITSLGKVELRPVTLGNATQSAHPSSRASNVSEKDSATKRNTPSPTQSSE
jgi:hypothetical protein